MKKLIALLLALIMAFSLVACDTKDDDDDDCKHKDKDGDGICDKCDEEMEEDEDDKDDDKTEEGAILSAAIIAQLGKAKSVSVSFECDVDASLVEWDDYDYETGATVEPFETSQKVNAKVRGTMLIVRSGSSFNAKVEMNVSATNISSDSGTDTFEQSVALYLIDGYTYTYDSNSGVYLKSAMEADADVEQMLGMLLEGVNIDEDAVKKTVAEISAALMEALNIELGKGAVVELDLKKPVNDFIAYINDLDVEKDTIGGVINDALALVVKDLTVEKIISFVEENSALTVNEALKKVDEWLTKEYKTTLQGIYDDIMADENVLAILKNVFAAEGADPSEIDAVIEQYKSLKIADLINEAEVGDVTLWDLFAWYVFDDEGAPTKAEFFEQVRAMSNYTLAQVEEMIGEDIFTDVKMIFGTLEVDTLNAKAELKLTKANEIESFTEELNVAFKIQPPSDVDGKKDTLNASASAKFSIHSISNTAEEITLPKDAIVVEDIAHYAELYTEGVGSELMYIGYANVGFSSGSVRATVTLAVGEYHANYNYSGVPFDAVNGFTVTLEPEYCDSTAVTETLVITYDATNGYWILANSAE